MRSKKTRLKTEKKKTSKKTWNKLRVSRCLHFTNVFVCFMHVRFVRKYNSRKISIMLMDVGEHVHFCRINFALGFVLILYYSSCVPKLRLRSISIRRKLWKLKNIKNSSKICWDMWTFILELFRSNIGFYEKKQKSKMNLCASINI